MSYVKNAVIEAKAVYPPVSAWEFEFLKTEPVVRDRLLNSTIYMILQRPMLWFSDVLQRNGELLFDIVDGMGKRVHCKFDPRVVLGLQPDTDIEVELGFHRNEEQVPGSLNFVASIKVYQRDEFMAWWSPQKILFEASTRNFPMLGSGDVQAFTDYDVHYIGQAFSQKVWDRLTGHGNLQSVLSSEFIRGQRVPSVSLEISLITLEILGVTEVAIDAPLPFLMPEGVSPIIHQTHLDEIETLETLAMKPGDAEATNELEAMLICMLDPLYNKIKYKDYPYIKSVGRSKGYSHCEVFLTDFPFRLRAQDGTEPLQDV